MCIDNRIIYEEISCIEKLIGSDRDVIMIEAKGITRAKEIE